jgi:hypothetical protein
MSNHKTTLARLALPVATAALNPLAAVDVAVDIIVGDDVALESVAADFSAPSVPRRGSTPV